MTAVQVQVRWDATAIKIAQDVIAIGMSGPDTRAEIARRFGVPSISDNALRNAFVRAGLVLVYGRRFVPPITARGIGPAEVEPPTQRSERVPTVPPQPSGRVEVVRREDLSPDDRARIDAAIAAVRAGEVDTVPLLESQRERIEKLGWRVPQEFVPKDDAGARVASERAPADTACRAFVAPMVRGLEPDAHECVAAFPDIHFGVHDQRAVDQALEVVHAYRPKSVVVLGDTLDGAAFSRHQRSRRPISFNDELAYARPFFKACEEMGARNLVYCKGNHEHRLETYLHTHAAAVADLPGNTLEQMIDLSAWRVVPYHQGIDIGPVHYTHDIGYSGVNAVRQALTRHAVSSFVQGHLHTATTIMLNIGAQNRPLWSASFGWLGDPDQVDWRSQSMVRRECPHAIGIIRGGENGWHSMETVRIQRGGTMVNGRWIK